MVGVQGRASRFWCRRYKEYHECQCRLGHEGLHQNGSVHWDKETEAKEVRE